MSLFGEWMKAIGFHGKQVAKAGETIGLGRQVAGLRYRGEKELSHTERLAMAAVTAGLPAWSPANHDELEAHGKVIAAVRDVLAR